MGFSPAQARAALARTSTGVDVQAALETLLAVQGGQRDEDHLGEEDEDRVEYERIRREEAERERRRARRAGPSRELVKPRTREEREASGAGDYAVQADKVLAQASEIGQSVFSKASSFWAAGKEKAMKVYEEQRRAYEASQAQGQGQAQGREYQAKGKVKDVRPRWMTEAKENGHGRLDDEKPSLGGFRDDEEKGSPPKQLSGPSRANGNRPHRARVEQVQRPTRDGDDRYISAKERADLLFAEEVKSSYKSPARHRTLAIPVVEASRTPRVATPVQLITRKLIDATPSQVQSSAAAKVKGNEHFKLGRFTEAETAYSTAISSLPEGHLLLVPLWNNRAATRLKLGESEGAVADCAAVIDLVGPGYHPSKETPLSGEYAEVKLGDALVKATITRAQAWEMGEKWKRAAEDWERAMAFDSILLGSTATNTRNLAADGARRAKRMLQKGEDTSQLSTEPAFKVSSTSQSAVLRSNTPADVDKSKAVSVLRKAAAAAEAENTQQLELKDRIDAKVMAWKGGKENNLRALIASLDTVLWEEVMQGAGMKVGMHELISEKQVRIRYMKVIARLHPDKVSRGLSFSFPLCVDMWMSCSRS
jgi:tetratricopeptide (TPR) repeat protein